MKSPSPNPCLYLNIPVTESRGCVLVSKCSNCELCFCFPYENYFTITKIPFNKAGNLKFDLSLKATLMCINPGSPRERKTIFRVCSEHLFGFNYVLYSFCGFSNCDNRKQKTRLIYNFTIKHEKRILSVIYEEPTND